MCSCAHARLARGRTRGAERRRVALTHVLGAGHADAALPAARGVRRDATVHRGAAREALRPQRGAQERAQQRAQALRACRVSRSASKRRASQSVAEQRSCAAASAQLPGGRAWLVPPPRLALSAHGDDELVQRDDVDDRDERRVALSGEVGVGVLVRAGRGGSAGGSAAPPKLPGHLLRPTSYPTSGDHTPRHTPRHTSHLDALALEGRHVVRLGRVRLLLVATQVHLQGGVCSGVCQKIEAVEPSCPYGHACRGLHSRIASRRSPGGPCP
jgi:hypothetical protein